MRNWVVSRPRLAAAALAFTVVTLTVSALIPVNVSAQTASAPKAGRFNLAISRFCVDTTMEVWVSTINQASRLQTYIIFDVVRSHGCGPRHSRPVSEFFGFAAMSLDRLRVRTSLRSSRPGLALEMCRLIVDKCPDADVELRWAGSSEPRRQVTYPVRNGTGAP